MLLRLLVGLGLVGAAFVDEAFQVDWLHSYLGPLEARDIVPLGSSQVAVFDSLATISVLDRLNGSLLFQRPLADLVPASAPLESHSFGVFADNRMYVALSSSSQSRMLVFADNGALSADRTFDSPVASVDGLVSGTPGVVLALADGLVYHLTTDLVALDGSDGSVGRLNGKSLGVVATAKGAYTMAVEGPHGELALSTLKRDQPVDTAVVAKAASHWTLLHAGLGLVSWKAGSVVNVQRVTDKTPLLVLPLRKADFSEVLVNVDRPSSTAAFTFFSSLDFSDSWQEVYDLDDLTLSEFPFPHHTQFSVLADFAAKLDGDAFEATSLRFAKPLGNDVLVQYSSGTQDLVYLNGSLAEQWTRPHDALVKADIVGSAFVALGESTPGTSASWIKELAAEQDLDLVTAFSRRLVRHAQDLTQFAAYLRSRIETVGVIGQNTNNVFGFKQVLVVATASGALIGLDTENQGKPVWTIPSVGFEVVDIRQGAPDSQEVNVFGSACVAVVNGVDGTIASRFCLTTGETLVDTTVETQTATYLWTSQGRLLTTAGVQAEFENSTYVTKTDDNSVSGYIIGEQFKDPVGTWQFVPATGFSVTATAKRNPHDQTVSVGVPLGDRSVLYKYLYPNAMVVVTQNPDTEVLQVSLVDTVTGRVLYSSQHAESGAGSSDVHVVFGEHWVVYSYASMEPTASQKLVVWDLYESAKANERIHASDYSSLADLDHIRPHVLSQSFFLPGMTTKVHSLTVTRTRFGITQRALLMGLSNGQVLMLPKRAVDARRPVGDISKDLQAEGLVAYDPYMSIFEGANGVSSILTHERQLSYAPTHLAVSPAILESTVLVAAQSRAEVFFTRVAPSQPFDVLNSGFSKDKLMLTMAGLAAAIAFMKPVVDKRALTRRWA